MKLRWDITDDDIAKVKAFLGHHKDNPFVRNRIERNASSRERSFSREHVWRQLVACLLTSQQKSGPQSAVSRLIHSEPFPLAYSACCSCDKPETLVQKVLIEFGGIRRYTMIAAEVSVNLRLLEQGHWSEMESAWSRLMTADDRVLEREVARRIDGTLKGFGPKQSRNLLQSLGLTKYEIPLDSRIMKGLREFGFPLRPPASALGCPEVYELILDGVQELCRRCGVYPCILDAAIFASFDGDGWKGVKTIW